MPGASQHTQHVKTVNANWTAGSEGGDGKFAILLITDDDERHVIDASPAATLAVLAITTQPQAVLMWDPEDSTLIAANLRGHMPWTERFVEPR
jgi:hypothetical protein